MGAIHVLAPALWIPSESVTNVAAPHAPVLARMLARARHQPVAHVESFYTRLFDLFGIHAVKDADLPVAAATHWSDFANDHDGCWLRIDPVHLRPDLGKLLLFDAHHISISPDEVSALLSEINLHLREYDAEIVAGAEPSRWYLRTPQPPRLQTTSPQWLNGKHIDRWLARGADAPFWHRLLTEIQMILHRSVINERREAAQDVPINSLWPWGSGMLPAGREARVARVASDDPVAAGLARSADVPLTSFEDLITTEAQDRDVLWAPNLGADAMPAGDGSAWRAAVSELDGKYFSLLIKALGKLNSARVVIHLADGTWSLDRSCSWRIWRRPLSPKLITQFPLRP